VIFELSPAGTETVLWTFTGGADGAPPTRGLVRDSKGNLYGTTTYDGNANCYRGCGVVYKIIP
jgi:hypothetical protein